MIDAAKLLDYLHQLQASRLMASGTPLEALAAIEVYVTEQIDQPTLREIEQGAQ